MPQSVLSLERIQALVPAPIPDGAWEDLLFASKADLEGRDGDAVTISVTPDRLDLLSEAGLSLYLAGVMELARGLPPITPVRSAWPSSRIDVDPSVAPVRPAIAAALVQAPPDRALDAGTLAEAIRFQELLHATVGRDRRAGSLGIYPLERLDLPVRYTAASIPSVRFVPLDGEEEVHADRFFAEHPYAARFGALGRSGDRCLVLEDREGSVLSLPPILNSRTAGEARPGDRALLLESTGTSERTVREMVGLLLVVFAARGWSVEPVAIHRPDQPVDPGTAVVSDRTLDLPAALVRSIAGESLPGAEVERRIARTRLGGHAHPGGWAVAIPPWRPDLLTAVDLVEDIVIAAALRPEAGIVPPSSTRGRRRPEVRFRREVATDLLGLGFAAPYTSVLVSEASVRLLGDPKPMHLLNPVSSEFAYVRDRLLPSHLTVLGRNTRHAYPQRFAEVGPVVVRDPTAETGASTRYHASLVLAAESAGFAEVAALAEYLLRRRDIGFVREPADLPGRIPGRAARMRVAGEPVAEIGELHPAILAELGVPVPVATAEIDLSSLWTFAPGREAP